MFTRKYYYWKQIWFGNRKQNKNHDCWVFSAPGVWAENEKKVGHDSLQPLNKVAQLNVRAHRHLDSCNVVGVRTQTDILLDVVVVGNATFLPHSTSRTPLQ